MWVWVFGSFMFSEYNINWNSFGRACADGQALQATLKIRFGISVGKKASYYRVTHKGGDCKDDL